jgi:hypothetical protein
VLLKSLLNIHKHLQQGPTTSNEKLKNLERFKTPSDALNHGPCHNNVGRCSSKKRHGDARKIRPSGNIST